jgi:6,7-dimethyl-8-ribityllumazine synthase
MQRQKEQPPKTINGSKLKIGIVVSLFNDDITGKMLAGAMELLEKNKVKPSDIKAVWVPGSFEIPLALKRMAASKKFDALVALGCVIKGETDHFYFVAGEASRAVMDIMLEHNIPIGFGIITTDNLKQAQARSSKKSNKGAEAAEAALMMIAK